MKKEQRIVRKVYREFVKKGGMCGSWRRPCRILFVDFLIDWNFKQRYVINGTSPRKYFRVRLICSHSVHLILDFEVINLFTQKAQLFMENDLLLSNQ